MEVENTPLRVETRVEGVKKRPISCFDAREGLGRSIALPSRRSASRRGGGGEETPRLAFRHEGGSEEVENPSSRRNASRRGGGGEETPRLAFRHEGGSGEVENTPLASKRKPKRGAGSAWVPNTSVSKGMFAKGGRDLVG